MKVIIPMAGMGKRMRPHTLTMPKPLIPIAGKPIVERLVEEITTVVGEAIEEIAFIIGDFGKEVEDKLVAIAEGLGAKGTIYYQKEALGTAHAVHCAKESLTGNVIVAFADTLFKANFTLEKDNDAIIWVQKVDDPSAFGVVKVGSDNVISDFVEKPKEYVSDLAIIGIYYFKDGDNLRDELQFLLDNNIVVNGEYQLTDALENMKNKGLKFSPGQVDEWLDCGNKDATVYTNQRVLEHLPKDELVASSAVVKNATIIEPCYIGENAVIENSVVGPHVSLGDNSTIKSAVVKNSIIQQDTSVENVVVSNSMIGGSVYISQAEQDLNIGDFTTIK